MSERRGPAPKAPAPGGGPRGPRGFGPRQPLDKKALARLLRYLKPYWPRLILVLVCIVLNAVATAMAAKFLGTVIDSHIGPALRGEMTLEESGLLTRCRCKEDERCVSVCLTEKGWALREQVKDIPEKVGACISLPKEETFELYKLLRKLLDNIEE